MTDEDELRDAFEYLIPLAKQVARQKGYRVGQDAEQLYTQALTGAWLAAKRYDATKSTSLWRYAAVAIPRYIVDEHRSEAGRKGKGGADSSPRRALSGVPWQPGRGRGR